MLLRPDAPVTRPTPTYLSKMAVWPTMLSLTDGTDTAPVAGTRFWSSLPINDSCILTGIGFLIGSVGGTDRVIVELHDSKGELVATSTLASGGTVVGTTATIQQVPFIQPVAIRGPGLYYLVIQINGTTCRFRTLAAGTSAAQTVVTGSAAGTNGTSIAITPGTTFTAGVGPIAFTY